MTKTHRLSVWVYQTVVPATLFTKEEALMLQLLCIALDHRDAYDYIVKTRVGAAMYFKRDPKRLVCSNTEHLTPEHMYVVSRKVKYHGRQRQYFVLRKTLTQRRPNEGEAYHEHRQVV